MTKIVNRLDKVINAISIAAMGCLWKSLLFDQSNDYGNFLVDLWHLDTTFRKLEMIALGYALTLLFYLLCKVWFLIFRIPKQISVLWCGSLLLAIIVGITLNMTFAYRGPQMMVASTYVCALTSITIIAKYFLYSKLHIDKEGDEYV